MDLEYKPLGNIDIHAIMLGTIGNNPMQFHVGQKMIMNGKEVVVSSIVRDESSYSIYGEIPYMIFGKVDGVEKLIKVSVNQPIYLSTKI